MVACAISYLAGKVWICLGWLCRLTGKHVLCGHTELASNFKFSTYLSLGTLKYIFYDFLSNFPLVCKFLITILTS